MTRHERWEHIRDPYLAEIFDQKRDWERKPTPWWIPGLVVFGIGLAVFSLWARMQ